MNADLHAIGRTALDGPTSATVAFHAGVAMENLLGDQRGQIGNRVAHTALFGGRGDNDYFTQGAKFAFNGR